jgi:N-carbamoylputrescine amidase
LTNFFIKAVKDNRPITQHEQPCVDEAEVSLLLGHIAQHAVVVAEMDLDMIDEVRATWQFYRDRRPETYGDMVKL